MSWFHLYCFHVTLGAKFKTGKQRSVHVNVMMLRHLSFKGINVTLLEGT